MQTSMIHNPSDLRGLTEGAANALSYAIATEQHGEGAEAPKTLRTSHRHETVCTPRYGARRGTLKPDTLHGLKRGERPP